MEELVNLFDKLLNILKNQTNKISIDKIINNKIYEEIEELSANINFNSKYIIFKSIVQIDLKKKINENLKSNSDKNKNLIILYEKNKLLPIKLEIIKNNGFIGGMIRRQIEDIMLNLSNIYLFVTDYLFNYKMNLQLRNEISKYYLFYKEQYDKFILLNKFIDVV